MLRLVLTALALLLAAPFVHAQDKWPSRPIKVITPFGAGTGTDFFARWYAGELQKSLGVPVTVDNKPGASGIIGTDAVAKASADGYTLLYGFNQLVTINPHVFARLPYDAAKSLQPLAQTTVGGYILVVNNDFGPKNLQEVIALAKAQPNTINYGSYGPGTVSHLTFELISKATNTQFVHVPYKQAVLPDVMGGVVPMALETSTAVPFVKSGKLRAIAVTGPKRLALLPDVPTVGETLPNMVVTGWQGFFAPAGLPRDIAARLTSEIVRITNMPETVARIRDVGGEPSALPPSELPATIQRESAMWASIIKEKNIRLD